MKANELMIGDWVHVEAHRGFNAQNVKVEAIPDNDGDNKYGHHYGHIGTWLDGGDNDFLDVEAKHLQPIPLTPEILEKNGFYYDEDRKAYLMGVIFRVKPERYGLFSFEICGCPYTLNTVHELQHALRLCRIEKEIIL